MGRTWEKHIQVDERYHWFVKDYYDEHRRLHKVRRPGFCHTLLEVSGRCQESWLLLAEVPLALARY